MPHASRRYDAVISDIDGCLGPESAAPVDVDGLAKVAAWNREAAARGDRPGLTVCSGRPQPYAEAICRVVANATLPCVAEMGVWIYDPRDNRFLMDPGISHADIAVVRGAMDWIEGELGGQGVVMQPGKTASISLWHPDTAYLKGLIPSLRETFAAKAWPFRVTSTVAWVNLELEHVSKGTGVVRLMKMCELRKERVAGIGDTMGDMAIREHVGFFACPANADDGLKKAADYVSPYEEVDGVLDILERVRR